MDSVQQFRAKGDKNGAIAIHDGVRVRDPMHGTITNSTALQMDLLKFKNWAGTPEGQFPSAIPPGGSALFTHLKADAMGSVASVVYSGTNAVGNPCAWILAWNAPTYPSSTTPKRVYVDCGPLGAIDAIPWDQIQMNLENAPESNFYQDIGSNTMVKAKFDEIIPDPATVEATFSLMPGP